jgi:hypothetical protein
VTETTVDEVVVTGKRRKKRKPLEGLLSNPLSLLQGAQDAGARFRNYVASGRADQDVSRLAKDPVGSVVRGGKAVAEGFAEDFKEHPVKTVAGLLPLVGGALSALDTSALRDQAEEARQRGDESAARRLEELAAISSATIAAGVLPGGRAVGKAGVRAIENAAERDVVRDMAGMAEKYGVEAPEVRANIPGGEPIKAYHGSPHKFDRFDMSKLRTGEGANIYGEGLYVAQHPAVARTYREMLAGPASTGSVTFRNRPIVTKGAPGGSWGMELPDVKDVRPSDVAADLLRNYGKVDDVIAQFRGYAGETRSRWAEGVDSPDIIAWNPRVSRSGREATMRIALEQADLHDRMADFLEKYGQDFKVRAPGYTYEVNINASPEQFLDWDKTLQEQSPLVRGALEDFAAERAARANAAREAMLARGVDFMGRPYGPQKSEELSKRVLPEALTGQLLYKSLNLDEGAIREGEKGPETRRRLLDYGIVGNTYRDQGSRYSGGEGAGTNNFVVFDDSLLDITDRYAKGGLAEIDRA